jgi:polar amino acid transport system permease protein
MQNPDSRRNIATLPIVERLATFAATLPWWALIIAVGLGVVFFSFLSSPLYRRALVFVTDDPRLSTTQFANVIYEVRAADGSISRVSGVITGSTPDGVIITTQAEAVTILPIADIARLDCPEGCPAGSTATVLRGQISGRLTFEDLGRFQIVTDFGQTIDVRKVLVDQPNQKREPEGCSPSQEGRCRVTLPLKPGEAANTLTGIVKSNEAGVIELQTAPEQTSTVRTADITNVIRYEPAQCALNNIGACNEGIFLTVFVAIAAFAVAVIIGLLFGLMRISSNPLLFNLSTVYVEVVRGVPLLVTLLFVNFALAAWLRDEFPKLVPALTVIIVGVTLVAMAGPILTRRWNTVTEIGRGVVLYGVLGGGAVGIVALFGANSNLAPVPRAILGLSVCYGAYLAELFRAGIQSIGRGQSEAARSLGMTYLQSMRYIILPQAFRVVLPPLGNEFIAMLKDTSLIAILALPEMTQKARLFAADTFLVFEPYITIGVLYLCMTLFLSFVVRTVEKRITLPH